MAIVAPGEPTRRATLIVDYTVPPPTLTPQRTPTMMVVPSETPIPLEPSSTVRPLPTSTIAGDEQQ